MKQKAKLRAKPYDYTPVFSVTTQRIDKKGIFRGYNTYHVGIVTVIPCENCGGDHIVYQDAQGCPYVRCHADQTAYQRYTDICVEPVVGWGNGDAKKALRYVLIATDKDGDNERVSTGFFDLDDPRQQEFCGEALGGKKLREVVEYFDTNPNYVRSRRKPETSL